MRQYNVTGMSCAACSARVEKAVGKVPGVTSCSVSLLTNSMGVEGDVLPEQIIAAVEQAGYGASEKGAGEKKQSGADATALEDKETPVLKRRLIASVGFLLVLMYFSMGHMMWGWPLPAWFEDNHIAMGLVQLLLAGIVMVINQKFFISGFKSLWHRSPNMDTLVAMGSMASFLWSVYVLFAMTRAQVDGNMEAVMDYMMDFYFEIQGKDHGCTERPYEYGTEDRRSREGRKRSHRTDRTGRKRRYFCGSPGREYSGGWKDSGRTQCSQ